MAVRASAPVRIGANLAGLVIFVACVFPVYWMVNTSMLPRREINAPDPTWLPLGGSFDNYRRVLSGGRFFDALGMSLGVTVATVAVSLSFAFLAALAVTRFRFRGRKSFIVTLLLIQMIPVEGLFISQYKMLEGFNLLNTIAGLTLVYVANVLPFTVWTLRGFLLGVPPELEEAAQVDGSSRFGAFVRILLPLIGPGLVATSIFAFIQAWNEYLMASVLVHSAGNQTLTLWLASFITDRGTAWGPLMAGATLTALPVVLFFVAIQRRIAFGLTAGAVRG